MKLKTIICSYFVWAFILLSYFDLSAASENYQFRHISEKQGLKHTWIQHITKDSNGYMWFSTIYGAYRYNGYNFEDFLFPIEEIGVYAKVNLVYEDNNQTLWFGTDNGIYTYNSNTGERKHYCNDTSSIIELSSNWVYDIVSDKNGNIWVAGDGGVDLIMNYSETINWAIGNVRCLQFDIRGNLWAGNTDGDIYVLDNNINQFKKISIPELKNFPISDIYESKDQSIWIATIGNGLFNYNQQNNTCEIYNTSNEKLQNNIVRQVIEDQNGYVYAGTEHGIVRISQKNFSFISSKNDSLWSLNDNAIYSLYCDNFNNLWVGTFFGGVNVMYNHNKLFNYLLSYTEEYSIDSKVVSCIYDSRQNLYVGTENDGVYILENGKVKSHITTQNSNISSNNIHSVCIDKKNNLWIGSYYGGLFMQSPDSKQFNIFAIGLNKSSEELTSNNIYCITCDSRGNLWVGTQYGGLYRYDYTNKKLVKLQYPEIKEAFVWDIHEDVLGDIWLACHGRGLWRLSRKENYKPMKIDLPAKYLITLCELSDGRILVGTEKEGMVVVDPITLDTKKLTSVDGLIDNTVYGILEDDNKNIWLSTNIGLCKTNNSFSNYTYYSISDGLPTNRFNYNSAEKIDGTLYFGSINGVVVVNPQIPYNLSKKGSIRLNNLYINNVKEEISPDGILKTNLNKLTQINLAHWQNSFAIDFYTNTYGYSASQHYAYKMEGIDNEWHFVGTNNKVQFIGLKAKRYKLTIAEVVEGKIIDNSISLKINIIPIWWQSDCAKILFALFVILALIWCIRLYLQISKHKHELELEKVAREKEKELNEIKFKFFTNVSHEFKTPISLILGPVEQFLNGKVGDDSKEKYLGIIKKNAAKLLDLINELLEFREIQFYKIKSKLVDLELLVKTVISRHIWLFDEKKIKINTDFTEKIQIMADERKFEKIFDNLLSNAYKHTNMGGEVTISAFYEKQWVKIVVEDNGEGIHEDKLPYIFERFFTSRSYDKYSSGVGLSYVKSIVEQHGGHIQAFSRPNEFTRFEISIPTNSSIGNVPTNDLEDEYKKEYDKMYKLESIPMFPEYDNEKYKQIASDVVILLVEDDYTMRDILYDFLKEKYTVICVDSAEAASKTVYETKVDIIVSDVMLSGGMTGFDLCHNIKNSVETSHIKVILMTVLSEQDYKYQGYKSGADAYLIKPFKFSMLELRIRNLVISAYKVKEMYKIEVDISKIQVTSSNSDEQLIRKITNVIFDHMSESDFNVDDLCNNIGMSKATLYRKLKTLTGQSTNEFIQNIRLKYATKLLKETDKTISEIAYEVGFTDPYYFSRAFKKLLGHSPKGWRENNTSY